MRGIASQEVQEFQMSDALFVLGTIVAFGLGILYLRGCELLK